MLSVMLIAALTNSCALRALAPAISDVPSETAGDDGKAAGAAWLGCGTPNIASANAVKTGIDLSQTRVRIIVTETDCKFAISAQPRLSTGCVTPAKYLE